MNYVKHEAYAYNNLQNKTKQNYNEQYLIEENKSTNYLAEKYSKPNVS